MTSIVLRVRLTGGDSLDVTYNHPGSGEDEEEAIRHAVSTLADPNGHLPCRHGQRLLVLYARGVATLEVSPRGAVL
jgi:hypothetical protein